MKIIITEDKFKNLKKPIQLIINNTLYSIKNQSEEWGLGEMDEIYEIDSIDKIIINRIDTFDGFSVYIDIYQNKPREEYDNTISEIEYRLKDVFPGIVIYLNKIIQK